MFDEFWNKYRELNKTGKAKAKDSYDKAQKKWCKREGKDADEFSRHVLHNLFLEQEHKKKLRKAGEFVPSWPMASTWLNQERYDDEWEQSSSELNEKAKKRSPDCECGKPSTIQGMCDDCYNAKNPNRYQDELRAKCREQLDKLPKEEGETWNQWFKRARKHFNLDQTFRRPPKARALPALDNEQWDEKYGV